jgi:hypothetical protein
MLSLCAIIPSSTERARAVVDCQRLVLGQQARLDVAQVLTEHESLPASSIAALVSQEMKWEEQPIIVVYEARIDVSGLREHVR